MVCVTHGELSQPNEESVLKLSLLSSSLTDTFKSLQSREYQVSKPIR